MIAALESRLNVDVVILYNDEEEEDELKGTGGAILGDPEDVELELELERQTEFSFRSLLSYELKAAVAVVSKKSARTLQEAKGGTVSFHHDNFVPLGWADIRRLLDPASWSQDRRQRRRMAAKMAKVHEESRWPDRHSVLKWAISRAEEAWSEWEKEEKERRDRGGGMMGEL